MGNIRQFRPIEDFQRARSNALGIQAQEQGIAREASAAPIRNQLGQLGLQQQQASSERTGQQNVQEDALQKMTILNNVVKALASLPEEQRVNAFNSLEPELVKFGIETSAIKQKGFADNILQQAIITTQGLIGDPNKLSQLSAGQREFQSKTEGLSEADVLSARRISLGLDPRAVGSAIQTITGTGTAEDVAETEETIAAAKESGKLTSQLKLKPAIQAAIKTAEAEAKANAETFTALKRAKAALPGLTDVINQLKTLAPIATNTFGGRAFDTVVKELGFGGTKGATARAKFVSLINNQVLPLLRETFGAAFTAQEGESLKATMGDVNASNEEKLAQLNAFIEQKFRDIETKQRELDQSQSDLSPAEQAELEQLRQLKAQQ